MSTAPQHSCELGLHLGKRAGRVNIAVPITNSDKAGRSDTPKLSRTNDLRITTSGYLKRHEIAEQAGVAELAQDTAVSLRATNSIEQMLCHQLAAAHNASMKILGQASVAPNIDSMIRLTSTSLRVMETFHQGALTLAKLRNGGRQTLVVQRVNVTAGAQAVIAGNVGEVDREGGR